MSLRQYLRQKCLADRLQNWIHENEWDQVYAVLDRGGCPGGVMSNFYTLMNSAAKLGRVDVMDVLYTKYNIPLDGKDAAGCTVLGHAIYRGHLHVVQWLLRKPELSLEANASKNKLIGRESALEFARHRGATEIADCIAAEEAARARWSSLRVVWLAACVRACE